MKTNDSNSFHKFVHDIRGGLAPILIYAQLIANKADTTTQNAGAIKKSAKEIENCVKSLVSLLDKTNGSFSEEHKK